MPKREKSELSKAVANLERLYRMRDRQLDAAEKTHRAIQDQKKIVAELAGQG